MIIYGEVNHWPSNDGVRFDFKKIDPKKKDEDNDLIYKPTIDLPFEIWQKFKGKKVKITIEKES